MGYREGYKVMSSSGGARIVPVCRSGRLDEAEKCEQTSGGR